MKRLLVFVLAGFALSAAAQPFSKTYLMSFHVCDASCMGFQDHITQLAESNDGLNWTLVPNFPAYSASVPDIITRGNKAYIFSPGKVRRYDNGTGQWDATPQNVSIIDSVSAQASYVDPSAIIDSSGNIVLFFLNATGITGDPAGCSNYPCTKYFDSATEIPGSDGTQFVKNSGHRISVTLTQSPQTGSDPDIFFDGTKYVLYVSQGPSTLAASCSSLHGTYSVFPNLPAGVLVQNIGGIPCGHYDASSNQYWTFVHSNVGNSVEIRRAAHSDFNTQLTSFTTVISGPVIGEPASTKTESPGFCVNTLLTAIHEQAVSQLPPAFPNPGDEQVTVNFGRNISKGVLSLYDQHGKLLRQNPVSGNEAIILKNDLAAGLYFIQLQTGQYLLCGKLAFR
ncbi:MAG: hypothetical protein FD123_3554 [Bacteroidetes bacterium]|nr:MAG: hypothetical protein FD123_3554 [Bacteroidota bacterium]